MILIADSSALIALSICNALKLLESIFETIRVPRTVYEEITQEEKKESENLALFLTGKIEDINMEDYIFTDYSIGKGELEAMALYKKLKADRLLLDDKKAKKIAALNGINTIGSLGVLLLAKEKGFIKEIKPYLEILRDSDIFIRNELLEFVLELANE